MGEIIIGIILTEALIEGLHRQYWLAKLKERVLDCLDHGSALHEFIRCKYCQSWWIGWVVALAMVLWCNRLQWGWDWLWMGIVFQSGANILHSLRDYLWSLKFGRDV